MNNRISIRRVALSAIVGIIFTHTASGAVLTGVSLAIEDYSTDWQFQSIERSADINHWKINLEEKTISDLRIGINIGQMGLRIRDKITAANAQKFDLNSLGVYLRWPLNLNDHFSIPGRLSYQISRGTDSNDVDPTEIDWNQFEFLLGFGFRWQLLRITPYIVYLNVNGDISNSTSTDLFESVEEFSPGLRVDYFVDSTAYVRLQIMGGSREGVYLVFAREY